MVSAPCRASYGWTAITCGVNYTIAAVTEVHCLCDVICCLAVDWERLHGSFSWSDMKTLRKFHILGVKVLQSVTGHWRKFEGHVLHMKLFTDGWMPLRMAGTRQMMPFTVEPQHRWWMNATWNKWNLSLNVCTVFHALPSSSLPLWLLVVCTYEKMSSG